MNAKNVVGLLENYVVGRNTIGKSFRFWKRIRSAVSFGLTTSTLMFARVADFAIWVLRKVRKQVVTI